MTGYLLDTSIASILDRSRGLMTAEFEAWLMVREPRLHLSSVTILETGQGISKLIHANQRERARALEVWLDGMVADFGDRLLPMDTAVARIAGELSAHAFAIGRHPGLADIMIAATAREHGLLLLTRNTRHFLPLEIEAVDPTEHLPR